MQRPVLHFQWQNCRRTDARTHASTQQVGTRDGRTQSARACKAQDEAFEDSGLKLQPENCSAFPEVHESSGPHYCD
jgi:hypothetical protein